MSTQVWTVTRVASAEVIRGCCGRSDAICNCQPDQCTCTATEGE